MRYHAEESRKDNLIGGWLKGHRQRLGLSQRALCERLSAYGVSVGSGGLSKWETGEHIPSPYQLHALRLALHAEDPFGAFSAFEKPKTEDVLSGLNEAGRAKALDYLDDLRASGRYDARYQEVRLYTMPVSAGTGLWLEGEDYETIRLEEGSVPAGTDFCVRVRGDSMTPRFQDGQLAFVHRQRNLREGEVGVFVLDGEAFLKQLRYEAAAPEEREQYGAQSVAVLVSLNEKYPPRRVKPGQRLDLVGRVLEAGRLWKNDK